MKRKRTRTWRRQRQVKAAAEFLESRLSVEADPESNSWVPFTNLALRSKEHTTKLGSEN